MSKGFLIILLAVLSVIGCSSSEEPIDTTTTDATTSTSTSTSSTTESIPNVMLTKVNEWRTKGCKCGNTTMPPVPQLKWNALLEKAAQNHANDMSNKGYFSHTSQDGTSMSGRITNAGYLWQAVGENIAAGYANVDEVVKGWIASEGHCKNIMSASYTEVGGARKGSIWVQDFGRPR